MPRSRRTVRLAITVVSKITLTPEKPENPTKSLLPLPPNFPRISPNLLNPSSFFFSFLFSFPFSFFPSLPFPFFLFSFPFLFFLSLFPSFPSLLLSSSLSPVPLPWPRASAPDRVPAVTRDADPSSFSLLRTAPHRPATRPLPAARRRDGHQCACPEPSPPPNSATATRCPLHVAARRCSSPLHDGSRPTAPPPIWPRIPPAESTLGAFLNRLLHHCRPHVVRVQGTGRVTAFPAAIKGPRRAPRITPHHQIRTPLLPKHPSNASPRAPPPPVCHRPRIRLCTQTQPKVGRGINPPCCPLRFTLHPDRHRGPARRQSPPAGRLLPPSLL
jgi:hypothetical protein